MSAQVTTQPLLSHLLSFRRTIVLFTVSVLISIVLSVFLFFQVLSDRALDVLSQIIQEQIIERPHATADKQCRKAPQTWSYKMKSGALLYAYDAQTFRSHNPRAPRLPQTLVQGIRKGRNKAFSKRPLLRGGGQFLLRIGPRGPCSLLYVEWTLRAGDRWLTIGIFGCAFGVGLLLCFGLGYLWIARPLLQRIRLLAQVAQNVGLKIEPNAMPNHHRDDDLITIERSLKQAHQRIVEDTQKLHIKNQALRNHFANIAHDLRTPIASLQLLLERSLKHALSTQVETLQSALSDTIYLEQLTNEHGSTLRRRSLERMSGPSQLATHRTKSSRTFSTVGNSKTMYIGVCISG